MIAAQFGADIIKIDAACELSRADSPGMVQIAEALRQSVIGQKTVIVIDEIQGLPFAPLDKNPGPVKRFWNSLIYGSGTGWNRTGTLEFAGEEITFNAGNILIIGMTNHAGEVGGKRNADAVQRRFRIIPLSTLSDTEMRKALPVFFERKGFSLAPDALTALSSRHRGTFAAAAEISQKFPFGELITLEIIREVSPECEYQARGFTRAECKALKWLLSNECDAEGNPRSQFEPSTTSFLSTLFPSLNVPEFIRHAKAQKIKGEERPFIFMASGGNLRLTDSGKRFVKTNAEIFAKL